jgi:HSP20 family molecular chaperone IbpA
LAKLIEAPAHMDVLFKIREIINPMAEKITGCPILSFERSKVDWVTGEKVTFCWWLNGQPTSERQEPLLDIFDEGAVLIVYLELFGIVEDKLKLRVVGDHLIIDADQNYHKEIFLPSAVDAKSITTKFHNNLLEVRLAKVTVPTV